MTRRPGHVAAAPVAGTILETHRTAPIRTRPGTPVPAPDEETVLSEQQAIEPRHPPAALMKLVNPVVRRLVARGRAGEQLLVLHLTGRRTGQRYDVPAGYQLVDGVPTVFTNSGWRHNCAGGADVEVTLRGERRAARATLVDDPPTVATVYRQVIGAIGWQAAQRRMGIRITVGRTPTLEELQDAVTASGLSLIRVDLR